MEKNKVIAAVQELPDEINLEQLIERLIFIDKVDAGLEQLKTGNTIPHHAVEKIVKSWQA